jgi:CheY-like chemotaxis protein
MPPEPARIVLVVGAHPERVDAIEGRLRQTGVNAYAAHSTNGCLRVATSVGPDLILLDASVPRRVEHLLKAHPVSSRSRILRLSEASLRKATPRLGPIATATA